MIGGLTDFNQSSNGLHNSYVNAGVKCLVNKGLMVLIICNNTCSYLINYQNPTIFKNSCLHSKINQNIAFNFGLKI